MPVPTNAARIIPVGTEPSESPRWLAFWRPIRTIASPSKFSEAVVASDGTLTRSDGMRAGIVKGADGADGRDVIEAKDCREVPMTQQQLLYAGIGQLRRMRVFVGPNRQIGCNLQTQKPRNVQDGAPAASGVGAEKLAAHVCDLAVTQRILRLADGTEIWVVWRSDASRFSSETRADGGRHRCDGGDRTNPIRRSTGVADVCDCGSRS